MEAYKVWATLNLKGDALKKMEQFSKMTKRASSEVDKLIRGSKSLTLVFEKMGSALKLINPDLAKFSVSFIRMNSNIGGAASSMGKFNSSITSSSNKIDTASRKAQRLAASLNAVAVQSGLASRSMGGIKGAGAIVKSKSGLSKAASGFGHGVAAGAGVHHVSSPGMAAGLGLGAAVYKAFTAGSEYQKYMGQFKVLGFDESRLKEIEDIAKQGESPGISRLDVLRSLSSAQMATRNFGEAKLLAPALAKAKLVSGALYEDITKGQIKDMMRSAEIPGGSDTNNIKKWLDVVNQMYTSSGGTIDFGKQRTFWSMAIGGVPNLDPRSYLALEPVIQEIGGAQTGTALTTGARSFSNPKQSNFARYKVDRLKYFGLWDEKTDRMKKPYLDQMNTRPEQFILKTLLPAFKSKGVTSKEDITAEINSTLPRTYGKFVNLVIKNEEKIRRAFEAAEKILGIDESKETIMGMHNQKIKELTASFESFSIVLDKFTGPALDGIATGLSKIFNVLKFGLEFLYGGDKKAPAVFTPFGKGTGISTIGEIFNPIKKESEKPIIQTNVIVDGKVLAKSTSQHMGSALSGLNQQGTSGVNPGYHMFPGISTV